MIRWVLVVLFFLYADDSYCQKCSVKVIAKTDKSKGISVKYPVFNYKDKATSDLINEYIKSVFYWSDYRGKTIDTIVGNAVNDGLTTLDHLICFCNKSLLSFKLRYEGMGAYPSYGEQYFNFIACCYLPRRAISKQF